MADPLVMADPVVNHLPPVDNIRLAYYALEGRVTTALRTQLGDAARLGNIRAQALSLLQNAQPVCTQRRPARSSPHHICIAPGRIPT